MDIKQFQESITDELNVVKNRVRNLIGNRHWGEEGKRYMVLSKQDSSSIFNSLEDAKKSVWYLNRLIQELSEQPVKLTRI